MAVVLTAVAGLAGAAGEAAAATFTVTAENTTSNTATASDSETLSFARFDPGLGTLTGVRFTLSASTVTLEAASSGLYNVPQSISFGTPVRTSLSASFAIRGPGAGGPEALTLFSGIGSASSASTATCSDVAVGSSCSSAGNDTEVLPTFAALALVDEPPDLAAYVGTGDIDVVVLLSLDSTVDECPSNTIFCTADHTAAWSGDLTLEYLYRPAGAPDAVPAPGTLATLGAGLFGLGLWRRRNRSG